MVDKDFFDNKDVLSTADQLKNQEQEALQQEKIELETKRNASSVRMQTLLNALLATLSPLLVQTCALYQMVGAGELKSHQIPAEMLRTIHEYADLTMVSALPNSSTFCKAETIVQLTTRELQRRQDDFDARNADQIESEEDGSTGFMHISIPIPIVLEGALVEIHEGVLDDAFDIAQPDPVKLTSAMIPSLIIK